MRSAALVLLGSLLWCSKARGAVVEASSVTAVAVDAPHYDTRLGASGGCNPAGCSGDLTRDGDSATPTSRWSCKPNLGTGNDAACSITYTLASPQTIQSLNIAMHKGDTRSRTMEIYVDGTKIKSWTSSGTTTAFENVEIGVDGQAIELRGLLGSSEWLSIVEVEILVDDGADGGGSGGGGSGTVVEAGILGTVTASADLFDARLASENGCDHEGCTADLTRDGDVSQASRWSCAPSLGGPCSISYDLGASRDLTELRLAMYKGASRVRTVEVYVDDTLATTWTSSGTTADFEGIDLSSYSGKTVTVSGVQARTEWLSIVETEIMVKSDGVAPSPSPTTTPPAPVVAPVATAEPTVASPEQLWSAKEIGKVGSVTASAELFDPRCTPSGCTAALTRDGDLAEISRWSCSPKLGDALSECTISYDLGEDWTFAKLHLALYKGATRTRTLQVEVDGSFVREWTSSGTTDGFEVLDLTGNDGGLPGNLAGTGVTGRVIELTGVLSQSEWLSIIETEIMVWPKNVVTSPPAPTPSPMPVQTSPQPVQPPVEPTGDLQTVGLLPLASARGVSLDSFYLKDGDFATSWTCSGNPTAPGSTNYACVAYFNMFHYRHIKQVKIALPSSASATAMRITGDFSGDLGETFVTSSGNTDGFETYDFDLFTNIVVIAGVFTSAGQSISISEVEFVEEVQPGQVPVARFNSPYDNGDGLWTIPDVDAFAWFSDSEQAVDRTLSFGLSSYATVDAIELQFPAGDTYKFDLEVFDGEFRAARQTFTGLESENIAGWQSFDLTGYTGDYMTSLAIKMKGTGSGAPGFKLLDARIMGTLIDNPTNTFVVGSTFIDAWEGQLYPDFVGEGTGDQKAIMEAICAVKKASFDGVDCIGGDDAATGTVKLPMGAFNVDGNIFIKSGVYLDGRYSIDDSPYYTSINLEEGALGKTDIDAIIVADGISDAKMSDIWIRGNYDPEGGNDSPVVSGLGSAGFSIVGSNVRFVDGDALVVRNSQNINIDAGPFDDEYLPWTIGASRGTGILVDSADSVWVRRTTTYDNGVAGIHIMGSNNFTFEATIAFGEYCSDPCSAEGEGNVGSVDGQQPIEVIVEDSTLIKFQDMRVQSSNNPVMTISGSTGVSFNNCGFSKVEAGTCVIQLLDDSEVTTGDDPELLLADGCYVKQ